MDEVRVGGWVDDDSVGFVGRAAGGAGGVFVEGLERGVACAGGVDESLVVAIGRDVVNVGPEDTWGCRYLKWEAREIHTLPWCNRTAQTTSLSSDAAHQLEFLYR